MNNLCKFLLIIVCLSGCHKNNTPAAPVVLPTGTVTSLKINRSGSNTLIDSFQYDNSGNLARICQLRTDSTLVPIVRDSIVFTFSYSGNSNLPSTYSYFYYALAINPPASIIQENDSLVFDGQGRLIKDTVMNPSAATGFCVDNFGYTGNTILIKDYMHSFTTPAYSTFTDYMVVVGGNLNKDTSYGASFTIDFSGNPLQLSTLPGDNSVYSYSALANPLYNPQLANSMGPFLRQFDIADFISRNLISEGPDLLDDGGTPSKIDFSWTAGPGKTILGAGTDIYSHKLVERVTFNLK